VEEFPSVIDDLLEEFDRSRRAGRPETIEEALVRLGEVPGEVPGDLRRRVFIELIKIDLVSRFPSENEVIDALLKATVLSEESRYRATGTTLGIGGLGKVLESWDVTLGRSVALKEILERHADSPKARDRFVREASLSARLEHPNIVPIYDIGRHSDGRRFYVMRKVTGPRLKDKIADYHEEVAAYPKDWNRRHRGLLNLLGHLLDACAAVAHAHKQEVIHRDLTPVNIMVGEHGETLVVDWGLACVVEELSEADRGDDLSVAASPGHTRCGTPQYVSPEQAQGQLVKSLAKRTDIFGLGAILYEILTGCPPFDGDPRAEVLARVTVPPRVRRPRLRIDPALEAVCLKAMAHRPEDRYDSAEALAEELRRWLADEPVTAWPEPWTVRGRRWARQHRLAVSGAAVALVVGVSVLAVANLRLTAANAATERALTEARDANKKTEAALARSEESRKRTESVLNFLKDDVLAAARPAGQKGGLGKYVTVRQAVDAAEPKIAGAFRDQPAVEAYIRDTLGRTYLYLGEFPPAIRQFERALKLREAKLGPDDTDTLIIRNNLALAYLDAGRTDEAIKLLEGTLRVRESRLGPDDTDTLIGRSNLAVAYEKAGQFDEAIALHRANLRLFEAKLGPDHPDTLTSRNNLAAAYFRAGRLNEAIEILEATLRVRESRLGPDHPDTLTSRNNLGAAYRDAGRFNEAIEIHEATLRVRESRLGPGHPDTLQSRNNLAVAYSDAGRFNEAIEIHEATLRVRESRLGPGHPDTLATRCNLAAAYRAAGRTAEAIEILEATLRLCESKLGPDHFVMLASRNGLAQAYETLGRWSDAEAMLRDSLARRRKAEKADSLLLASDLALLGSNLLGQAKWSEAEPLFREALTIREKATPDDWQHYDTMSLLGGALLGQDRYAQAKPLIVPGYEGMKAREARIRVPARSRLLEAAMRVVRLYEDWNKPDQAAAWKAKLGLPDLPTDVFARP
jgi:tetratricopeptide (TPR) repeat protein